MQRVRTSTRRQTLGSVNVNHHPPKVVSGAAGGGGSGHRRQSIDPGSTGGQNGGVGPAKVRPPRGRASMIPRVGRENAVPPPTPQSTSHRQNQLPPSGGGPNSGMRRTSMGVGSSGGGDRRQSALPPGGAPSRVDPRPISDKGYQQDCIHQLISFLQKSGYEHPISTKSLTRPSGKEFNNIVTFMLRKVDPSFQDGTLKMEDEVAMNFKAMGYPFGVSKTALVAAGSPHTWPTLLAALTWLARRIQCMEALMLAQEEDYNKTGQFESLEELETETDRFFFKYLSASYSAFLKGDEKLRDELMSGLADKLESDDSVLLQEIEQMTDRNAGMVEKMNNLSLGDKDLHDLTKTRDGYITDLEQFHDLINQMEEHVAKLTQQKKDLSEELEETKTNLTKVATRVKELNESIANQGLTLEDVRKMENERKGVEEAIDRALTLRDQRRSALWEIESELEKLWSDLESFASDYNSNLGEINVLDVVAAKGVQMKATVNKGAAQDPDSTKLLALDLPGLVHPTLASCREEYTKLLSESKWLYQEALDQLEISEEQFTESLEKLRIIESKIDKCEEVMEAEREAQEAKLGVRAREAESMEAKVASLRDPVALEEHMAQFERQCAELEAMRQQHEEENVARKKAVCDEIYQACLGMKEYDEYCLSKIKEVQQYREEKQATYGKLRVP